MTADTDSTTARLRQAAQVAREASDVIRPGVGEAMAAMFDRWARMGEFDAIQLHRGGGPETVALADAFLAAMSR